MRHVNTLERAYSEDIFERVRPLGTVAWDWLTIEPIWRGYKFGDKKGAAVVAIALIFIWYIIVAIPLVILGFLLTVPGIVASGSVASTMAPIALVVAVVVTAYGGYRAWSLLSNRRTVVGYADNPDLEKVVKSFEYLHRDDEFTRAYAANTIAIGMEQEPQEIVRNIGRSPKEVVFEIAELLHDQNVEVRQAGSESLVYLSQEFPEEVAKYRDDIYAGVTYPDSVVQSNCALAVGNLAYYEPALADEAVQYITQIVDDPDPEVRVRAALSLGMIHTEKAQQLLQKLKKDSEQTVRQQAENALQAQQRRARMDVDTQSDRPDV